MRKLVMAGFIQPLAIVALFGIAYGFKFFSAKYPNGLRSKTDAT